MKKEKYLISISGEDGTYTTKEYTKKEAKLVSELVDELQTNREGCAMCKLPNEKELAQIRKRFDKWCKTHTYTDIRNAMYNFWRDDLAEKYNHMYDMYYKFEYWLETGKFSY